MSDMHVIHFQQQLQNWICRYLPDENRNMMISRSSGRSGVDVNLITYNNIMYNSIIPFYSPIKA